MDTRSASPDYFPLGFVHGDPSLTNAFGYDFRQVPSSVPEFADGGVYTPAPDYRCGMDLQVHSLAIAGESLAEKIRAAIAGGTPYIETLAYGRLPLALDADGTFRKRLLDSIDIFNESTRRYLEEYAEAHVRTHSTGALADRILLWGLDNEWEGKANYSATAVEAFVRWLETEYSGDLRKLNTAWKTDFGSFAEILSAPQIQDAQATENPGRFLDWWRFQSGCFTSVLVSMAGRAWQCDPLRRGVVHKATQLTIEMPSWRERLLDPADFAARIRPYSGGFYGIDMYGHGDRQAYEVNYIYHCIRASQQDRYHGVLLCENNNHNGPASQFEATQLRLLANGMKGCVFFTTGFSGGKGDWDHFAFMDAQTGAIKDKMYSAARFANHVRRSERFWRQCAPAEGMPRVALLMPKLDVLVSQVSDRNPDSPRYSYPQNHRWLFYRRLREQGYWVDVIAPDRLTTDYMKPYQALCLVGADHLTDAQCAAIESFVQEQGGVLLADALVGTRDEHHLHQHGLDKLLGVDRCGEACWQSDLFAKQVFQVQGVEVTVGGLLDAVPASASVIADDETGRAQSPAEVSVAGVIPENAGSAELPAFINHCGNGTVIYLPFAAGTLELNERGELLASITSEAATAESEEYVTCVDERIISNWLHRLLAGSGVLPGYRCSQGQELFRIELPQTDADGNCAVVVATRAGSGGDDALPEAEVEMVLPDGNWQSIQWYSAEDNAVCALNIERCGAGGRYRFTLPRVRTAGVLQLFGSVHPPLLATSRICGTDLIENPLDQATPCIGAGGTFDITFSLIAVASDLADGELRVVVPEGWSVWPEACPAAALARGGRSDYTFRVTAPSDDCRIIPDRLTAIKANWCGQDGQLASAFTCVEAVADSARAACLLSDNAHFPPSYPYRIETGAGYRYLEPADSALVADPLSAGWGAGGSGSASLPVALQNGFSSIGGQRHSHHRDCLGRSNIAAFNTGRVVVEFDLKAVYSVMRVVIVAAVAPVYPQSTEIAISEDGTVFNVVSCTQAGQPELEFVHMLGAGRARYVRITVCWAKSGGALDEIEIWGRAVTG